MAHPLFDWLQMHLPAAYATLRPPATPADVAAAESALGHPLPEAFKALHLEHDGQEEDGSADTAVFEGYHWAPLAECLRLRAMMREVFEGVRKDFPESEPWDEAWLPFADDHAGGQWVLDVARGRVLEFYHEEDPRSAPTLGDSFEDFLARYVASLASGERYVDPEIGIVRKRPPRPQPPAPAVNPRVRRASLALLALYALAMVAFIVWLERRRSGPPR